MKEKIKFADQTSFTKGAVFVEKRYVIELPNDHTLQDCLRPDYWKTVTEKISRLAVITVLGGADDLDVDLRCIDKGNSFAIMRVIRMMTANDESSPELQVGQRRVEYRPGFEWCVIGHDNGILRHNFASQILAQECLRKLSIPEQKPAEENTEDLDLAELPA